MTIAGIPQEKLDQEVDLTVAEQLKTSIQNSNTSRNNIAGNVTGVGLEIGTGYATDLATANLLNPAVIASSGGWSVPLYGVANFTSGVLSNWAAQRLRGEEEISWGELLQSGFIDIIPYFGQKLKGAKGISNIAFQSGARAVAGRQTEKAIDQQEWLTPRETLEAALVGGAFGTAFKGAGEGINVLKGKYRKYDLEDARDMFPTQVVQELINQGRIHKVPKLARIMAKDDLINSINGEDSYWAPLKRLSQSSNPKDKEKYTEIDEFLEGKIIKTGKNKGTRKAGYFKREESNEILKSIAEEQKAAGKKVEGYRRVAGFIPLKDRKYPSGKVELGLESIARKHGYTIEDVTKYLIDQEDGNKYMHILKNELNEINRDKQVNKLEELYKLKERMGKAGFRTTQPWYQIYKDLLEVVKRDKYQFGHKESLWKMFVDELSGGNRVTNTYIQSRGNWTYTDFYGKKHRVQGNTSLGARDDDPIYTLVRLQGSSENLEDDFLRHMMHPGGTKSIPDEYQDLGRILYRQSMGEVKASLKKAQFGEEYFAEVSRNSLAITNALYVMFKKADDLNIPDWILDDSIRLRIPAREIWKGLDSSTKRELGSLKNLSNKINIIKKIYQETLTITLENL